jgi:hypothetical protein
MLFNIPFGVMQVSAIFTAFVCVLAFPYNILTKTYREDGCEAFSDEIPCDSPSTPTMHNRSRSV